MTHDRPESRWDSPIGKLIVSLFLLVVGGLVNQFWNIPIQQVHQDDRLDVIEKHLDATDKRLATLEEQHRIMLRQLDDLKRLHE